ncbi:MAG TPA: phage/plasmid primase, P4 family [Xanthobacteraceae bacterium]|nr:phage/plasmid primase, P4 family [Xanthobacteraceae bacterium]
MHAKQVKWWLPEVEGLVRRLIENEADATQQREAWDWIEQGCGPEALAAAKKLFAERSAVEPKEEPEAKAKAEPRIGAEVAAKNAPYDNAKVFMWRHCYREGVLAVYWYDGNFWEWNGRCYAKKKMDDIEKDVWTFLDDARSSQSQGRFLPTPSNVGDLIKGLKALVAIPFDPPCWLDGRPAGNMLVFRNGVVDIDSGEIVKPTPKLWIHHELGFDYDPGARCPLWERWLGEVFAGDAETRECIEEQLGLGMTTDIRFQKGFLWIGKKGREGKGTLAFILERLCGSGAYASLSFHTWFRAEYSSEVLIGKKVGVFPDVRFKEGKWYGQNYDPGGIDHVSKEWVLKITGADNVTIGRKWQSVPWQGALPIKLFLISNRIPNLNDPILVSRFIMIAFNVSFADRMDVTMRDKLAAELPGIANRCLGGYRRLCQRGRFIQPKSGIELGKEVARSSNPIRAFIDDRCVLGVGGEVRPIVLFNVFRSWCEDNGQVELLKRITTPSHLSKELKNKIEELAELKTFREHGEDRVYLGIRLKTRAELRGEPEPEKKKVVAETEMKVGAGVVADAVKRGFLRRL